MTKLSQISLDELKQAERNPLELDIRNINEWAERWWYDFKRRFTENYDGWEHDQFADFDFRRKKEFIALIVEMPDYPEWAEKYRNATCEEIFQGMI